MESYSAATGMYYPDVLKEVLKIFLNFCNFDKDQGPKQPPPPTKEKKKRSMQKEIKVHPKIGYKFQSKILHFKV